MCDINHIFLKGFVMDLRYFLTQEEIENFSLISKVKEYEKGAVLFYENTPATAFYIILEGLVKGGRFEESSERLFHFFFPFMMVGEVSFREEEDYPLSTFFVTKGKALLVTKEAIKTAHSNSLKIEELFIRSIIGKVRYLQKSVNVNSISDTKLKTALFLVEHQEWLSKISIKEIASVLNTSRETISRNISYFIRIGTLKKVGNRIEIIDLTQLQEYENQLKAFHRL